MAATTPENKVKKQIKAYLKTLPNCWFYSAAAGPFSVHGIPDIICCINGTLVGIEVKAPGKLGTVTALQAAQIVQINGAGGVAFATDSLEDCVVRLKMLVK